MRDSREEVSDKKHKVAFLIEGRLYGFQLKKRISIDEHMNNYTKVLTDLVNMDVKIEEEDKELILLNSLPEEEYENFTLTLINGRQTLNYSDVSAALINYEVRRQDKLSSSEDTSTEALMVRGRGSNWKAKGSTRDQSLDQS